MIQSHADHPLMQTRSQMDPPHTQRDSTDVAILVASSETAPRITSKENISVAGSSRLRHSANESPHASRSPPSREDEDSEGFSCKRFIKNKFPVLKWLPKYKPKSFLIPDAISGVTVGLTAIPQSMAYANVAGLTPEYGLYSSFISCFVYIFLGSCRQMTIGPTALMELLVYETCGTDFPSCVVLIGFWVGVIQFIMGMLKLGAVVSLISDPVTIGFVAGASLTICSSQLRSFLGLTGPKGNGFIGSLKSAIENINTTKVGDTCLGVGCVIALLLMKNLKDYVKPSTTTTTGKFLTKLFWVLSIGRNALVVIASSILAASLSYPPFALTGTVKSGFPPIGPPEFELPDWFDSKDNINETSVILSEFDPRGNGTLTFWETWSEINTAPLMIAVISILQNVAIAKAFGSGQSIDATQEMIALGVSHIIASFFQALPTAGSFTRSAVNEASGVKSPIGGIFTGLLVIFALSFLTRWFAYIPKASLAAVILCAVLPMIEYENIWPMWKVSKLDVLTALITFLASLFLGMEYGIIIGVGTSLALYFIKPVRPSIEWTLVHVGIVKANETMSEISPLTPEADGVSITSETTCTPMMNDRAYHFVKPEQGFLFPSVDAIRTKINKLALQYPDVKVIALDCGNMIALDYTSSSALSALVKALKKTGKMLVFVGCREEWICMMKDVGLEKPENFRNIEELNNYVARRCTSNN